MDLEGRSKGLSDQLLTLQRKEWRPRVGKDLLLKA